MTGLIIYIMMNFIFRVRIHLKEKIIFAYNNDFHFLHGATGRSKNTAYSVKIEESFSKKES